MYNGVQAKVKQCVSDTLDTSRDMKRCWRKAIWCLLRQDLIPNTAGLAEADADSNWITGLNGATETPRSRTAEGER